MGIMVVKDGDAILGCQPTEQKIEQSSQMDPPVRGPLGASGVEVGADGGKQ